MSRDTIGTTTSLEGDIMTRDSSIGETQEKSNEEKGHMHLFVMTTRNKPIGAHTQS